jgi:hypothetical protein
MNAHRRKLSRLFTDRALTTIIIEHRDRLAHLGVEHLKSALSPQGPRILADDAEVDDDLVGDMTEVLTSFCAWLYGPRGLATGPRRRLGAPSTTWGRWRCHIPGQVCRRWAGAKSLPGGCARHTGSRSTVLRGRPKPLPTLAESGLRGIGRLALSKRNCGPRRFPCHRTSPGRDHKRGRSLRHTSSEDPCSPRAQREAQESSRGKDPSRQTLRGCQVPSRI